MAVGVAAGLASTCGLMAHGGHEGEGGATLPAATNMDPPAWVAGGGGTTTSNDVATAQCLWGRARQPHGQVLRMPSRPIAYAAGPSFSAAR